MRLVSLDDSRLEVRSLPRSLRTGQDSPALPFLGRAGPKAGRGVNQQRRLEAGRREPPARYRCNGAAFPCLRKAAPRRRIAANEKVNFCSGYLVRVLHRLFQSPPIAKHRSSRHLRDAIVSACLDHPAIKTPWPKESSDDFLVEPKSIRDDQMNLFEIHSAGKVPKDRESVLVASFADHCRRPKPRPHLDHGEDPDWLFHAPDDRLDFVCLKLHHREPFHFSVVETPETTETEPWCTVACTIPQDGWEVTLGFRTLLV